MLKEIVLGGLALLTLRRASRGDRESREKWEKWEEQRDREARKAQRERDAWEAQRKREARRSERAWSSRKAQRERWARETQAAQERLRLQKEEEQREAKAALEEERRVSTSPSYTDGISEEQFADIVAKAARRLPRIRDVEIDGLVVTLHVESMTGITVWNATVDFNDYGHLTGWNTIWSENEDSNVPGAFAREVSYAIKSCSES